MTEKLVSPKFALEDGNDPHSIIQKISFKPVQMIQKLSLWFGSYGEVTETNFFESVFDHEPKIALSSLDSDNHSDIIKNTYYGLILKYDKQQVYR